MAIDFRNNQSSQSSLPQLPPAMTPQSAEDEADGVTSMLVNYNEKFKNALPAMYRDKEVFQCVSQLMMSQKSSSLLVGAPGVGKTKIVEEIARLIANGSPYVKALEKYTIYELPLANIMAGTSYRGELEQKVRAIIEWFEANDAILFIDEVHLLCGRSVSYGEIAQMLKPAMARGSIKIIGATTLQESKDLLDDPAFNRRFNKVQVCELSTQQTQEIIESVYLPKMQSHYTCGFAPGIAPIIVSAAEKVRTIVSHRPDNAITLLDKICAGTVLRRNYNIATCQDETLRQHIESTPAIVNASHVEAFMKEDGFGMPDSFDQVKSRILFRDEVIDRLFNIINDYAYFETTFPLGKPFRVDLVGVPMSGRTTLLKECAKLIDEQPVYLDLSDYSDAPSLNRIIGSPIGYVGSDSKQEMPFDIVESNPRKVIILDNADACHPVVSDFFKSAMGNGLIKYADNRIVDISKCVVLVSQGEKFKEKTIGFDRELEKEPESEIRISPLNKEETVEAIRRYMADMIAELKKSHTKYSHIPDVPDVPQDEIDKKPTPRDIERVARKITLSLISAKPVVKQRELVPVERED